METTLINHHSTSGARQARARPQETHHGSRRRCVSRLSEAQLSKKYLQEIAPGIRPSMQGCPEPCVESSPRFLPLKFFESWKSGSETRSAAPSAPAQKVICEGRARARLRSSHPRTPAPAPEHSPPPQHDYAPQAHQPPTRACGAPGQQQQVCQR